jgi:hypothetical protein
MGGREGEVGRWPGWSWPYYGRDEVVYLSPFLWMGGDGERLKAPNEL